MDELSGILIAVGGMFGGLLLLGWAFGDFRKAPAEQTEKKAP